MTGKVTLVGAGPGDRGLLTLKGLELLKAADVVLYDNLVSEEVIALIPAKTAKINVGKSCGRHPVPQSEINALILEKALAGLNVVRLKGGDPFVFGRGGEELQAVSSYGIEFEVVPGVSVSTSAGAYAGIPVTHRDFASSLHIITGHSQKNGQLDIDFDALVKLNGTLVFLMGVKTLGEICCGLQNAGMDGDTSAAIIENATLPYQRKFIGDISELPEIADKNNVCAPSVVIVGGVCGLSRELDWFSKLELFGKTVVVTRAGSKPSVLSDKLRSLGCRVIETPCIKIQPLISDNAALDNAVGSLADYSWAVFTSAEGVKLFFEYLFIRRIDIRRLAEIKFAAVGQETKREIERFGVLVDYTPDVYCAKSLADGLLSLIAKGGRVLVLRAKAGAKELTDAFSENGISFNDIPIYETVFETECRDNSKALITSGVADVITFTSASAVHGFMNFYSDVDVGSLNAVCIGEKTAEAAEKYGIRHAVSETATIDSMVEKVKEILR